MRKHLNIMRAAVGSLLLAIGMPLWSAVAIGGVNYELNTEQATATVAAGTYAGDVTIPQTIVSDGETYTVVDVGESAFAGQAVTSVKLPNTVKTIGNMAFQMCSLLTNVELGTSIEVIGNMAVHVDRDIVFTARHKAKVETSQRHGETSHIGAVTVVKRMGEVIIPVSAHRHFIAEVQQESRIHDQAVRDDIVNIVVVPADAVERGIDKCIVDTGADAQRRDILRDPIGTDTRKSIAVQTFCDLHVVRSGNESIAAELFPVHLINAVTRIKLIRTDRIVKVAVFSIVSDPHTGFGNRPAQEGYRSGCRVHSIAAEQRPVVDTECIAVVNSAMHLGSGSAHDRICSFHFAAVQGCLGRIRSDNDIVHRTDGAGINQSIAAVRHIARNRRIQDGDIATRNHMLCDIAIPLCECAVDHIQRRPGGKQDLCIVVIKRGKFFLRRTRTFGLPPRSGIIINFAFCFISGNFFSLYALLNRPWLLSVVFPDA